MSIVEENLRNEKKKIMEQQVLFQRDEIQTILSSSSKNICDDFENQISALEEEEYSATACGNNSEMENNTRQQIKEIEAQIHAAAKAVITSLEQDNMIESQDRITRLHSGDSFTNLNLANAGSRKNYDVPRKSSLEIENHSENGTGDSSSQHDAAIDDDVFSHSHQSKRSSWNSYQELINPEDPSKSFSLIIDTGEETGIDTEIISSVSNGKSPKKKGSPTRKVGKNISRSAFRTPSSVRAIQMSSPVHSSFPSSYSAQQKTPSNSQHGNPVSYGSLTKMTPSRLKPKKEDPLVLLHLTVMPLNYTYSCLTNSPELPESLKSIQESWRLLQDKLNDTVLERGVLLAHPQDSFETLEERLLEALELPASPRARILKCGHYLRSSSSETASSSEEISHMITPPKTRKNYKLDSRLCDVCGREIRPLDFGNKEKKFRIKIYASNGLMSAGAWAAAWREMERVDVEIEPYVEAHLNLEFKLFAARSQQFIQTTEKNKNFQYVDEEIIIENSFDQDDELEKGEEELKIEAEIREYEKSEEIRLRTVQEMEEQKEDYMEIKEEENITGHIKIETECRYRPVTHENEPNQSLKLDINQTQKSKLNRPQDSLVQLLIAATKVVLEEKRNLIIAVIASILLFYLVFFKSTSTTSLINIESVISSQNTQSNSINVDTSSTISLDVVTTTVFHEITVTRMLPTPSTCSRKIYPTL